MHKRVYEAKRESDLLTKRIITDKFRHHEFLLPTFLKKIISAFSLDVRKEKRKPIQEQVFHYSVCHGVFCFFLRWHDACPFNGLPKANHIRQFCYSYGRL